MKKYIFSENDLDGIRDSLEGLGTQAAELLEMLEGAFDDLNDGICGLLRQLPQNSRKAGNPHIDTGSPATGSQCMQEYPIKSRFICNYLPDTAMEPWCGTLDILSPSAPAEFEVCARGSMFHMVMGRYNGGNYLCIPNWGIGIDIADPDDCFWNYEHLRDNYPALKKVDAISIVNAMSAFKHYGGLSGMYP